MVIDCSKGDNFNWCSKFQIPMDFELKILGENPNLKVVWILKGSKLSGKIQ
jgi:hypothetical protein